MGTLVRTGSAACGVGGSRAEEASPSVLNSELSDSELQRPLLWSYSLTEPYTLIKPPEPGHGLCGPVVGAAPTLYMLAPARVRGRAKAMSD